MTDKAATVAVQAKVEEFKDKGKKEAENIVKHVFPKKILELNQLLESEKFALTRTSEIQEDPKIPVPDPIVYNLNSEGHTTKKRKLDGDHDVTNEVNVPGTKVFLLPNGLVPTNSKITELVDIIKPHILDLIEHANKIKMWITYLIPRIEDGNNFGVSIQEDTMAEARQVESEAATFLDQISRYYMTRGKIIAKVAKYPHIGDIRRTIQELDEKEFISLRLVVCELRNQYAGLHDLIIKNFDKIKKPRNANAEHMY